MAINGISTNQPLPSSGTGASAPSDTEVQLFQAALAQATQAGPSEAQAIAEFEKRLAEDILRKIVRDGCDRMQKVFSR